MPLNCILFRSIKSGTQSKALRIDSRCCVVKEIQFTCRSRSCWNLWNGVSSDYLTTHFSFNWFIGRQFMTSWAGHFYSWEHYLMFSIAYRMRHFQVIAWTYSTRAQRHHSNVFNNAWGTLMLLNDESSLEICAIIVAAVNSTLQMYVLIGPSRLVSIGVGSVTKATAN